MKNLSPFLQLRILLLRVIIFSIRQIHEDNAPISHFHFVA